MARPTIADLAAEELAEGALDVDSLVTRLVARGATKARNPQQVVQRMLDAGVDFQPLRDGRWVHVPSLTRGSVFTHRLTAPEVAAELVIGWPDWSTFPWVMDAESNVGRLEGRQTWAPDGALSCAVSGPAGWLGDARAGDLVGLRLMGGHVVELVPVDTVSSAPFADKRLRDVLAEIVDQTDTALPGFGIVPEVVCEVLAADPAAFATPGPPLSERFDQLGFEPHGLLVGRPGTNWSHWDDLMRGDADESDDLEHDEEGFSGFVDLMDAAGVGPDGALVVLSVLTAAAAVEHLDEPTAELVADVAGALTHPGIATALGMVAQSSEDERPALEKLGRLVAGKHRGQARAAALYVVATCLESSGRDVDALEVLDEALAADPNLEPALVMAARYADEAGDAQRALDLLRRSGMPSAHPLFQHLQRFAEPPMTGVARNAPCPCNSGRKYKMCCQRTAQRPLPERAGWLWAKVVWWALSVHNESMTEYAGALHSDIDDEDEFAAAVFSDHVIHDFALWGDRIVHEYAARRSPLLPVDERELLTTWLPRTLRLYEVTTRVQGQQLTLRDLDTGDEVTLRDLSLSRGLREKQLVLARLLPDGGGGWWSMAVTQIPRQLRAGLVDLLRGAADEFEVATYLAAAAAPPAIHTTDGEPVVLCTTVWSVAKPRAVAKAFDAELGPGDDGTWTITSGKSVHAMLTLDGSELTVVAQSEARADRASALVAKVAPSATVIRTERLPAAALASGKVTPMRRPGASSEPSDAQRAALQAHLREYERAWVDQEIPALGGMTPRQALTDPLRRRDLLSLLDDMDELSARAGENGMNPDRIRTLLGLTQAPPPS